MSRRNSRVEDGGGVRDYGGVGGVGREFSRVKDLLVEEYRLVVIFLDVKESKVGVVFDLEFGYLLGGGFEVGVLVLVKMGGEFWRLNFFFFNRNSKVVV